MICPIRQFFAVVGLFAVALSVQAQLAVNDPFIDTDRIGGMNGSSTSSTAPLIGTATATNTQWVSNRSNQLVASSTGMRWSPNVTSNTMITGYFPAVSLLDSNYVRLTLTFTTGAFGSGAGGELAVALVDGSPAGYRTTDGVGSTDTTYVGDTGYRVNFSNCGTSSIIPAPLPATSLYRRVAFATSNNLLGTSNDWGNNAGAIGAANSLATATATAGSAFAANTTYTLTITLDRLSAADVAITTSLTGGNLAGLTITGHDTTGSAWNRFDQLSLRLATGSTGWTNLNVTGLQINLVKPVPAIATQPVSQGAIVGDDLRFTVVATGQAPLSYQWRKDTVEITDAILDTLALKNVQLADAGSYDVVVTNGLGHTTSSAAVLTVESTPSLPVFTKQPVPQTAIFDAAVSFSVAVTGTPPITYQWRLNGFEITGATADTYRIAHVGGALAGNYDCVVTGRGGVVPSDAALLTVILQPTITTQPDGATVKLGDSHTFTVVATGEGTLTYQWFKDTVAIPGATGSSLERTNIQASDDASYDVAVTGTGGTTLSDEAKLTVTLAPTITTQPVSESVAEGYGVRFSVSVVGAAPLSYQWARNGEPIDDAIASSFSIATAALSDTGSYTVTVTNNNGFAVSTAAVLVVLPPGADLYVAPTGVAGASGTISEPTTLVDAISRITSGGTIWMRGGTYAFAVQVSVARGNNGAGATLPKKLFAFPGEHPVLDFSSQPYGSTSSVSNPRGLSLGGDYWHVQGLEVYRAADNGIFVGGSRNIVERCLIHGNRDSGLQIARISSSDTPAQWPKDNLVLNCEAYDNNDEAPNAGENADGFACKLTAGEGNVFRGCVAHHNIDDGWDLYTKTETGPIGPVTLDQCIAYGNGTLTNGIANAAGDKNGFKLGGEKIAVAHQVTRCIAFNNGKNGFTWNSNPGAIQLTNCTAWDNVAGNYKFDNESTAAFDNDLSYWTQTASDQSDRYGGNSGAPTGASNCFWLAGSSSRGPSINDAGLVASSSDFVTLTPPGYPWPRDTAGQLVLGDFAKLVAGSDLVNAGVVLPASIILPYDPLAYFVGLPDIGAREFIPAGTAPQITTQPGAQAGSLGGTITLTVTASGTPTLRYQWRKGGAALSDATTDTLTIVNAQPDAAGSYDVVVTNDYGSQPSDSVSVTVTQNYAAWVVASGLTGDAAAVLADPDGDGIPNLVEFALGLAATQAGASGLPALTAEGGALVFRFTRPKYLTGITYTVQTSPDLVDWTSTLTPTVESTTALTETLTAALPTTGTRFFARLQVTLP